jgi:DNA-binding beta-propeller fold protein YncE
MKALSFSLVVWTAFCLRAQEALKVSSTIPLPGVQGRIDHLAIDTKGKRLFVAALGNNTLEVLDLSAGKRIQTVTGCSKPQGVLFLESSNQIYVANGGDGTVKVFDGSSYKLIKSIASLPDADNLRYDARDHLIYVGYGSGKLGFIEEATVGQVAFIELQGHPESFQLERKRDRIFINVPDANQVAVFDGKDSYVRSWPVKKFRANFPMALDEANHRIFVGCRKPPRLLVMDVDNGKLVTDLAISGDTDDLFYDEAHKRLYVSCGEGFVDVIGQNSADAYQCLSHIPTAAGARTSLHSPDLGRFYLAVPLRGKQTAEIIEYEVAN